MNVNLKLSGLYPSLFLFVIRFSLIFQKKLVVGGATEKSRIFKFTVPKKNKGGPFGPKNAFPFQKYPKTKETLSKKVKPFRK